MLRAPATALLSLVSACSSGHPPAQPAGTPVTSLRAIEGTWSVVRFEDYEPVRLGLGGQPQAYVRVGPQGLGYMLGCNSSGSAAQISREGVLLSSGDGIQTLIGCGPEREARDGRFFAFFRSKPTVRWMEGGRIAMTSGKTILLLERPETRRLAFGPSSRELAGRWTPQMASMNEPGGGHSGYGFQQADALVELTASTIRYSGCPNLIGRFRYSRDYRLVGTSAADWSRCTLDGGSGYNDEPARGLLRVLAQDPIAERTEGGGLTLSAGAEVISLRRQEDIVREQERLNRAPPPIDVVDPPPPPSRPRRR